MWSSASLLLSILLVGPAPVLEIASLVPDEDRPFFTVQLARVAAEDLGFEPVIREMPLNRIKQGMMDGDVDLYFCTDSWWELEEIPRRYVRSEAVSWLRPAIFSRQGGPAVGGLEDIHGQRVGQVLGVEYFARQLPEDNHVEIVQTPELAVRMLLGGRLDVVLAYRDTLEYEVDSAGAEVQAVDLARIPVFLCLSRAVPETAATVRSLRARMIAEQDSERGLRLREAARTSVRLGDD